MKINNLYPEPILKLRSTKSAFFISLLLALFIYAMGNAQENKSYVLGSEEEFSQDLMLKKSNSILLHLSKNKTMEGHITSRKGTQEKYTVMGSIRNYKNASFRISKSNGSIEGEIILFTNKKGYQYYSDDIHNVLIKEVDINTLVCIDLKRTENNESTKINIAAKMLIPDLQSLPGATATVYLDFDGEVVSGTRWKNGGTINAVPSGYSDQKITEIWRIMAEDFRPFNINITTNRQIFEAAPINQRMMCIFTSTDDAAPGSGGVAYVNSFSSSRNDDPCWAFNSGTRSAGETGSHEVGHTLGLSHDGVPGNQYYAGHGQWSPIMGWSASRKIGHWSSGEYDDATNTQDDLSIISNSRNGFGYKQDDHADTINEASSLVVTADGEVRASQNTGLITTRQDIDMFSFITAGGTVKFDLEPDPFYPNLNIEAKIINGLGEELEVSSPNGELEASINTTLAGGTYFLQIDGVGEGNLSNGYSDYSSIGLYSISGSYAPGNNNQPPIANFEVTKDCNQVSFKSTSINLVDSYVWDFGDGITSAEQNPEHTYTQDGKYNVSLTVTNSIGTNTITRDNILDITVPSPPETENAIVCTGQSTTISLSGSTGYIWYDDAEGSNVIATGNNFETPELTENRTYYVSGTTKPIISENVGLQNIDNNSGTIHQGGYGLIFNAQEPVILKKAKVLAEGSGNRTLELKNASGDILVSKQINIPDGEQIIDININIPAGNNMEIGFLENANLFRNNRNVTYPYEISDVVSIQKSTAQSDSGAYYYYLYDWEITTLGECESDTRTEITVSISESPQIPTLSLNSETNEITSNQQFSAYQWYLGDQKIEGETRGSIFVQQVGSYKLEVFNSGGCSAFSEILEVEEVLSVDTPELASHLVIYPNPVYDNLNIHGLNKVDNLYSVKIVNLMGQTIHDYKGSITTIDTSALQEGVYFLVVNNRASKKFVKTSK